jgi:hypothetical protein
MNMGITLRRAVGEKDVTAQVKQNISDSKP